MMIVSKLMEQKRDIAIAGGGRRSVSILKEQGETGKLVAANSMIKQ